jgi:hypothetical protein
MKAYGGVDVQIHIFLTSALAGGEWTPEPVWTWRKFLTLPGLELHPSVDQPVASRYTDNATLAPTLVGG